MISQLLRNGWSVLLALAILLVPGAESPAGGGKAAPKVVYEALGYIVPVHPVTVSAKVAGQVVALDIEEGKVVSKGDVLARLEDSEYRTEVDGARAKLELATARFDKIKAAGLVADVPIAKAELALVKAELEKAEWRLQSTVIRAPVNGTILAKKTEVGNLVHPAAFNLAAGICDLADLRELEVELAIPTNDVGKIFKGQSCLLHTHAFPKTVYKGEVSRLMPVADRAKGALPIRVKIQVPPGDTQLRPELAAVVQFLAKGP